MAELCDDQELAHVLRTARTIAVLGAHNEEHRAAFYVPQYLYEHGYKVLGINPKLAGRTLWGQPVAASLADVQEPLDIIDVFRRAELLDPHIAEIAALREQPQIVWLQLGIRHDGIVQALPNIDIVQDRCTLAEHRRLGIGKV